MSPCRAPGRTGEAWPFLSLPLLAYAGAMAVCFHLFVTGYEEPTLQWIVGPEVVFVALAVR
jgi:hypothetical protein